MEDINGNEIIFDGIVGQIYDKFLSKQTSEIFHSKFDDFLVSYDTNDSDAVDLLRGFCQYDMFKFIMTIYINPAIEDVENRIAIFLHELAHCANKSLWLNYERDEYEELSARMTALNLSEVFGLDIDETDCLSACMNMYQMYDFSDDVIDEISRVSDYISGEILEYFAEIFGFEFKNQFEKPSINRHI